jgi:hypothetical protein
VRPPPLCVHALGSFKPLEAYICPLEGHSCPLGLNYAPWGSSTCPPPYVCAPWALLSPLRLIYVLWRVIHAPWDSIMHLGGQVRAPPLCVRALGYFKPLEAHICPLEAQLCPLGIKCIPLSSVRPPLCLCAPLMCARPRLF